MFGLLSLVVLVLFVVGVYQMTRVRRHELEAWEEPAVVDEPVSEPLPDELVEPLGDACSDIARNAVEMYLALLEVERVLARADGMAGVDAAEKFRESEGYRELIAERAQAVVDEHERLPEEAGWWLSFLLEKVEALVRVDDGERITAGTGGAPARGAARAAREEAEAILFACHEFSQRLLGFDLARWIKDEIGGDAQKAYARAVESALAREQE